MKRLRLWVALGIVGLFATAGSVVMWHAQATGDRGLHGRSYITTVSDSAGQFDSRGVITLHADHTMSVLDAGQGGPGYFFTSQLGSWKSRGNGRIAGRTIDFDIPPQQASIARVDFTMKLSEDRSRLTGSVTVTYFPIEADPLGDGGTVIGTFTFVGQLIKP